MRQRVDSDKASANRRCDKDLELSGAADLAECQGSFHNVSMKLPVLPHSLPTITLSAILAFGVGTGLPQASAQLEATRTLQPLEKAFRDGKGSLQTGATVYYRDNNDTPDKGIAFGIVQGDYQTAAWEGFSLGGGFLFAPQIWEDNDGDYDSSFSTPAKVRRLYLRYDLPDWKETYITGGRVGLADSPLTTGAAGDGMTFSLQGPLPVRLTGTAISRWIDDLTSSYDANGITETEQLKDIYPDAGEVFLNANLEVPLGSLLTVTPAVAYQQHVLATYGTTADFALPLDGLGEGVKWRTKGIGAYHKNEAIPSVTAANDFDNHAWSYLIFTGLEGEQGQIGFGYYGLSDNTLALAPGAFNHFGPLKEDDLYPANARNDAHLFYTKTTYRLSDLTLRANFGIGRNSDGTGNDTDSYELDLFATYQMTERVKIDGYFVIVQFDDQAALSSGDYHVGGARLLYSF